jgi:hypothetical protein
MKPVINKFGFEIEAEMSDNLIEKLKEKEFGTIISDGSIHRCSSDKNLRYHSIENPINPVEFVSNPIEYNVSGIKKALHIFQLLTDYRDKKEFHWNDSMGFHIHLSFNPQKPVDIWSEEFAYFFKEQMQKNFPNAYTLRSDNHYCRVEINSQVLTSGDYSNRYHFINYKVAYREHKTIEFRVFPTTIPWTMHKYLKFTFRMVEYFIQNSEKFLNKKFEIELDDKDIRKEEFKAFVEEKDIKYNWEDEVKGLSKKDNYLIEL